MPQGLGRLGRELALDWGTSWTRLYQRGKGVVLEAPSLIATRRAPGAAAEVVAVGAAALEMLGRTPEHIEVQRPLSHGVIAQFNLAEEMLRAFLEESGANRGVGGLRVLVTATASLTEVERKAVLESARAAGCREVRLLSKPLAAALGAGLPIFEPRGSLIMDIGGGTTEIALISLGGFAAARSLRTAGDRFTATLAEHLLTKHSLHLGLSQVERLKHELGNLAPGATVQLAGRDARSGKPVHPQLDGDELREAVLGPVMEIVEALRQVLEQVPPELAGDALERGLVLCGGGARLAGLIERLRDATGLPVVLAEDPERCALLGAGAAVEDPELLSRMMHA
jgi:rod shape-determining protein MreB